MYNRIYETMFEGSMYGKGPLAQALWAYVISKMKPERKKEAFFVELNPRLLKDTIGEVTEAEVAEKIEELCREDKESRSKDDEGKKLVREGQFLYRVVNGSKYQELKSQAQRREWMRDYMKGRRAKQKGQGGGGSGPSAAERTSEEAVRRGDSQTAERLEELQSGVKPGTISGNAGDDISDGGIWEPA